MGFNILTNQELTFNLNSIPVNHFSLAIQLDIFIIGSWESENLKISVDGSNLYNENFDTSIESSKICDNLSKT